MTLSEELTWRGFISQSTFADIRDLDKEKRTFYWGADPSADSMTIGNLAPAMMIRHFIDYGYPAILLAGGATVLIGDPDGKKQERELKDPAEISKNVVGVTRQLKQLFDGKQFSIVNNYDWFKEIGYLSFLREVGKNVSMTQLLSRDFIQSRIGKGGSGISYAEFSYALIQGYDFLHLYRTYGATLQVAGADQWGNSVTGVDLIRKLEGVEAHVLTAPLIINKQTGIKFGKSEDGAIWLDPAKTSPYKFYQFWLNIDDTSAEDFVKIYTLLDKASIEECIARHRTNPGERLLQRTLAHEVTTLIHGDARCASVERVTAVFFGGKDISTLSAEDLNMLAAEIAVVPVGSRITHVLTMSGATTSNGEARRLINGGGISVNGVKVTDDMVISSVSLVKKGKNTFILVR